MTKRCTALHCAEKVAGYSARCETKKRTLRRYGHAVRPVTFHDNAVVESFCSNLKSEQVKKTLRSTRAEAKSEIFSYIDDFYNRARRHKHLEQLNSLGFEHKRQITLLKSVRSLGGMPQYEPFKNGEGSAVHLACRASDLTPDY